MLSIAPSTAQPDPSPVSTSVLKPEIVTALDKSGIYISPVLQPDVNQRQIAATLRKAHTPTRVLLLEKLPTGVASIRQLAKAVHGEGHSRNDLVVVVTERPRSIVAYGAGLDGETLQQIVAAPAKTFDAEGYAAGIAQIVRLVDQEHTNRRATNIRFAVLTVGSALALAILFMRCRKRNA